MPPLLFVNPEIKWTNLVNPEIEPKIQGAVGPNRGQSPRTLGGPGACPPGKFSKFMIQMVHIRVFLTY